MRYDRILRNAGNSKYKIKQQKENYRLQEKRNKLKIETKLNRIKDTKIEK